MTRQLIVVDTETTGLHDDAAIIEVAAINVNTGETLHFVPHLPPGQLAKAQPEALQINRYYERGLFRETLSAADTLDAFDNLRNMLNGNTFAGSNPTFDAKLIEKQQYRTIHTDEETANLDYTSPAPIGQVWHHRLADLSAYAAGVLGLDPTEAPGLDRVAELLGVSIPDGDRHTALGDAKTTARCFQLLHAWGEQSRGRW